MNQIEVAVTVNSLQHKNKNVLRGQQSTEIKRKIVNLYEFREQVKTMTASRLYYKLLGHATKHDIG